MRKSSSNLNNLVNNYSNYNYIHIHDPKIKNILIERINYKNIYIYYIDRYTYDFIFLYNKSNKFYRFMIRDDKSSKVFTLVNDFYDTKVRDYFVFSDFLYIHKDQYVNLKGDSEIIDILKRIDT
jgi:hypothetical protein